MNMPGAKMLFLFVCGWIAGACAAWPGGLPADEPSPAVNLALHRPYQYRPAPNYKYCTDPEDKTQLTDGRRAEGHFWTQKETVGWNGVKPVVITIDLGEKMPIGGAALNTAAGVAEVSWPEGIELYVSDDGKTYYSAGDLVALSAERALPPEKGYAVHTFQTDRLETAGRYVMILLVSTPYTFVDEIEIFRGEDALLQRDRGQPLDDPVQTHHLWTTHRGVKLRLLRDRDAVARALDAYNLPPEVKQDYIKRLDVIKPRIVRMPRVDREDFRAVLPLNDLHREIFSIQAELWRGRDVQGTIVAWNNPIWDPLPLIGPLPPAGDPNLSVFLMQGEYRAAALNLSNSTPRDQTVLLQTADLPEENGRLDWLTVHKVAWTDTNRGIAVAAALPEAEKTENGWRVYLPSGMTRQVWCTLRPQNIPPGEYRGRIILTAENDDYRAEIPLRVEIAPIRFPARPALHFGGWDYANGDGHRGIRSSNMEPVLAFLRRYYVDSPWATSAVMPFGRYDEQGEMIEPPDTAALDQWIDRWPDARRYCIFSNVGEQCAGSPIGDRLFEKKVAAWTRFWTEHVRSRGVAPERILLLLVDEPRNPEMDAVILAWARAIRAVEPRPLIWEDPIWPDPRQASGEMFAACDILCPNRPMWLAGGEPFHNVYMEQQKNGRKLEFYSCSGPARLLDPYAYYRLQAWTCMRWGGEATYFWALSDNSGSSSWNEYLASSSDFTPFMLDDRGATSAKQMEAIRESIEDFEYYVMLGAGVARLRGAAADDAAKDLLRRGERLLAEGPARVCAAPNAEKLDWLAEKDRTLADRVRREMFDWLIELQSFEGG